MTLTIEVPPQVEAELATEAAERGLPLPDYVAQLLQRSVRAWPEARPVPHVFISHAEADREVARRVAEGIQAAGVAVWIDQWGLRAGDSIASRIEQVLSASDIVLVLLSPRSAASGWLRSELDTALAQELRQRAVTVIPALVETCEIPPQLAGYSYVDLSSDFEAGMHLLIERLRVASNLDLLGMNEAALSSLVADLLTALGFSVDRQHGTTEREFDLSASLATRDAFGIPTREEWVVEVKAYGRGRVGVDTLYNVVERLAALPGPHKGLVVTNGQLTSVAREALVDLVARSHVEVRVMDGAELAQLLQRYPRIAERYFPRRAAA